MKATKLIINWEEQQLSQVMSVNGQTWNVTVDTTPFIPVWDTLPSTPSEWQVFFNTTNTKLYIYDGTNWNEIQATIVS